MRLVPAYAMAIAVAAGVLLSVAAGQPPPRKDATRAQFERHLREWREFVSQPKVAITAAGPYTPNPGCDGIAAMGMKAVPLLMETMAEAPSNNFYLQMALWRILRCGGDFPPGMRDARSNDAEVRAWLRWWAAGPQGSRTEFNQRYDRWEAIVRAGQAVLWVDTVSYDLREPYRLQSRRQWRDAGRAYEALKGMGAELLPRVAEKAAEGDPAILLTIAAEIVGERQRLWARRPGSPDAPADYLDWWQDNQTRWRIPWPTDD